MMTTVALAPTVQAPARGHPRRALASAAAHELHARANDVRGSSSTASFARVLLPAPVALGRKSADRFVGRCLTRSLARPLSCLRRTSVTGDGSCTTNCSSDGALLCVRRHSGIRSCSQAQGLQWFFARLALALVERRVGSGVKR